MEFLVVFFYLAVQGEIGMVIAFLLVHFLSKEWDNIDIRPFLDLHNEIKHFLTLRRLYRDGNWLKRDQQLSDPVINSREGKLLNFESLN